MTCYNWEGLSKPLVMISACYIAGVEKQLIIFPTLITLGYGTSYSHSQEYLSYDGCFLYVFWELCLRQHCLEDHLSHFWCRLCEEKGMLEFFRILVRHLRWCATWFISLLLFRPIVLMFSNLFLWVSFGLVGSWYILLCFELYFCIVFLFFLYKFPCKAKVFLGFFLSSLYCMERISRPSYVLLSLN